MTDTTTYQFGNPSDPYEWSELEAAHQTLKERGIVRIRHSESLRSALTGRIAPGNFKSFEFWDTRPGKSEMCYVVMNNKFIRRLLNFMNL